MNEAKNLQGIDVAATMKDEWWDILTPEALEFVADLQRTFNARRLELLEARTRRQQALDGGLELDFLADTAEIRAGAWTIAPVPEDLHDRRVEITGPPSRKMVINALNSGARVFMADFEDSNAPTWANCLEGQINMRDAVRRTIRLETEKKTYELSDNPAVLMVRPRGWHLSEKNVLVDGERMSGSLFDFGLYLFHNAKEALARDTGPYFYLPKLESHLEARLWNDVFVRAQDLLGLPIGTIKATVLIETITAVFEMDEILYELRDHSAGLNCGRWDYIFSFIKRHQSRPEFVMPDRALVTMARHNMHSYSKLAIKTCHRRGAHAIGGMAAQIPIKNDPEANEAALAKVRADKERESRDGHDGTWVAHPGLVPVAMEIFDREMPRPNQLDVLREDVEVTAADLLDVPDGDITEAGLRVNIDVGIQYLEAWLGGNGCVPIYNLMEDAATSEISRTQVWQWIRHGAALADGRTVTADLVRSIMDEELAKLRDRLGAERFDGGHFGLAAELFDRMATSEIVEEFLTLAAYEHLD